MQRIEYRRLTTRRRFGVELEVGNSKSREEIARIIRASSPQKQVQITDWAQSNGNAYWHVKWDSTCGPLGKGKDNGWEVASYIACGYKDVCHIAQIANALRNGGVQVNPNCGLHIHIDIHDFTPEQAAVLVARWIKIERTISQAIPEHRTHSKYCRLLCEISKAKIDFNKQYEAERFWRLVRPTNYHIHDNNQKKVALNMVNYASALQGHQQRSTVELRLPEGTLYGSDVRNWTRIFLNFVELAKTAPMPETLSPAPDPLEELMVYFGLENSMSFYLLSKGLYEAKVWLLNRIRSFASKPMVARAEKKLALVIGAAA